jgi:putative oxidoreductase
MKRLVALVGRILIAVPFLAFGYVKVTNFQYTVAALAALKLPMPNVATVIAIIIELLGGLCLVIGFKTRFWAWLLFFYLIPITLMVHKFWGLSGAARMDNMVNFIKNIAILGALLLLAAFGPGSLSADKS